ncbi:hypothetical protein D3C81_2233240 [compost metagenome]
MGRETGNTGTPGIRGLSRSDEWPDENFTYYKAMERLEEEQAYFFKSGLQFLRSHSS